MADEPKEPYENDNTEYQFKDDQDELNYQYEEQETESAKTTPESIDVEESAQEEDETQTLKPPRRVKRRPVVVVIGVLVAVFIVYKVMEVLFFGSAGKSTEKVQSIPSLTTAASKKTMTQLEQPKSFAAVATQQKIPAVTLSKPAPVQTPKPSVSTTDSNAAIAKLEAANKQLVQKIEQQQFQNQTNVMAMQQSMSNMSNKFDRLLQELGTLSTTVKSTQQFQQQVKQTKVRQFKQQEAALRARKRYLVTAVIPGRAWLKGAGGSAATVTVGSVLPGYGRVVKIDPYSGVVTMTSGVIPYANNVN